MSGVKKTGYANEGIAVYGNANRRAVSRSTYPAYDQSFAVQVAEESNQNIALNDPEPAPGAYMVTARNRTPISNQSTQIGYQANDIGRATVTTMKESDAASIVELRRRKDDAFVF